MPETLHTILCGRNPLQYQGPPRRQSSIQRKGSGLEAIGTHRFALATGHYQDAGDRVTAPCMPI